MKSYKAFLVFLLGSFNILGGLNLFKDTIKYNVVALQSVAKKVNEEPQKPFVVAPAYPPTNIKLAVKPSDIPSTKPWAYYGNGNLRDHLHDTHGVEYYLMSLFLTKSDLVKLHSFLHNGGKL